VEEMTLEEAFENITDARIQQLAPIAFFAIIIARQQEQMPYGKRF